MAESSVPKIHYFPLSGRGEYLKLILEEAGKDLSKIVAHLIRFLILIPFFSNDRIICLQRILGVPYEFVSHGNFKESLGDKVAYGQLPVYEEGDFAISQSGTIVRYLAKKHGNGQSLVMDSIATHGLPTIK